MVINLNQSLVDMEGTPIPDAEMNKILANALQNSRTGDALKLWNWAVKLYNNEELDLDPSDFSTIRAFVEAEQTFPVLTKAQILTALDASKEAKLTKAK